MATVIESELSGKDFGRLVEPGISAQKRSPLELPRRLQASSQQPEPHHVLASQGSQLTLSADSYGHT